MSSSPIFIDIDSNLASSSPACESPKGECTCAIIGKRTNLLTSSIVVLQGVLYVCILQPTPSPSSLALHQEGTEGAKAALPCIPACSGVWHAAGTQQVPPREKVSEAVHWGSDTKSGMDTCRTPQEQQLQHMLALFFLQHCLFY